MTADGKSRAFVNDEPVAAGFLRRLGALLVEVQGQNEQVGLADPASHAGLLDAFAGLSAQRAAVAEAWRAWRAAERARAEAEEAVAAARRDEEWLRHAVAELDPSPRRRERRRRWLPNAPGCSRANAGAGGDRRRPGRTRPARAPFARPGGGPAATPSARLERLPSPNADAAPILAALGAAQRCAGGSGASLLERLAAAAAPDPRRLEAVEERLFALRAAARKHGVPAAALPDLLLRLRERLAALDAGTERVAAARAAAEAARAAYLRAARGLSEARAAAAGRLEAAIAAELPSDSIAPGWW